MRARLKKVQALLARGLSQARLSQARLAARLRRDEQGGILILGIILGVLLVAIVFHVATIGSAIMWRESTQDGADAVAYEGALWNARGMNIISQLNIFIAIFMGMLMFWRLIILFVGVLIVILAVLGIFFPPAMAVATTLGSVEMQLMRADLRIRPRITRIMAVLHNSQKVVASATPPISVAMSFKVAYDGREQYGITAGAAFGMQLFPVDLLPSFGGERLTPAPAPGRRLPCGVRTRERGIVASEGLLGWPVSLPVQADEDETDTICSKGAIIQVMIANQVLRQFTSLLGLPEGRIGDKAREVWSTVAESLSAVLCEDLQGVVTEKYEGAIDEACKDDPDRAKCEEDSKEKTKDSKKKKGPGALEEDTVHFAHPWFYTANGDLFMQSWGVVFAERVAEDKSELEGFARFPQFLGASAEGAAEIDTDAWQVAEAEMFFDCAAGWQSCSQQAPWTVGWRARLRRVHDPMDFAVMFFERALVETFWNSINRAAMRLPVGGLITKMMNKVGGAAGTGGKVFSNALVSSARSELRDRGKTATYDALRGTAARSAAMSLATEAIDLDYIH